MKAKFILALAIMTLVSSSFISGSETAKLLSRVYSSCDEASDFSINSLSCTMFDRCAHGYTYTYQCPDGTAFDDVQKVCNFVKYVYRCENELLTTTANPTTKNACKFNPLSAIEKSIFCKSATFKSFYPECCVF